MNKYPWGTADHVLQDLPFRALSPFLSDIRATQEETVKKILYMIWLQSCLGFCCEKTDLIKEVFKSPEEIYRADERELKLAGLFTDRELYRLGNKSLDAAKRIYDRNLELGCGFLTMDMPEYPRSLRLIDAPPLVLYIKGKLPKRRALQTAIVGTREATMVGRQIAFDIAYQLTKNNVLVVSGGALGIDTQAHRGALQAGGKTVCVMGCGIGVHYLMQNAGLREEIAKHGAVISEYPPDAPAAAYTFTKRNRLIAALTDCTLVVEAGKGSGALITAADAVRQKKAVFAVPGSIDNAKAAASNQLLAAGAGAVLSYLDILKWHSAGGNRTSTGGGMTEKLLNSIKDGSYQRQLAASVQQLPDVDDDKEMPGEKSLPVVPDMVSEVIPSFTTSANIRKRTGDEEEKAKKILPTVPEMIPDVIPLFKRKTNTNKITAVSFQYGSDKPYRGKKNPSARSQKAPDAGKQDLSKDTMGNINEKPSAKTENPQKSDDFLKDLLTENALSVYHTISETPVYVGEIMYKLDMPIGTVLSSITELEIHKLVEHLGYGRYVRK